ncbi:MAG: site-2 protease family protein [Thermoplasmata archaeon]
MLKRGPFFRDIYVPKPPSRIRFSNIEIQQITISILVLAVAFTIVLSNPFSPSSSITYIAIIFVISLIAVLTGFLLHELAHKVLAQKYGCWAEYRMSTFGLLFALITAFFRFVFAAPGAVHISGYISKEQSGKISAAGPLTNAVVAGLFIGIALLIAPLAPSLIFIPAFIAFINTFLAFFNMLPFPPLDGSKVIAWNFVSYVLILVLIGALFAMWYFLGDILKLLGL